MVSRNIIANEISIYRRVMNYILTRLGKNKNDIPDAIRVIIKYENNTKGGI